jgi:kynureninase
MVVHVKASDWRAEFPILERKIYLNSCSLGALSHRALEYVHRFHEEWHDYGASAWYGPWTERLDQLRSAVARLLNASRDEVALTASVSAALASIASSVDYSGRTRVVISELDFPTLGYQWMVRPGVEVVRVPSDDGATIDPARFVEAVDERTAILATSHVFFTTGAIQDLGRIADIAHAAGALFVVDAYQSGGQVPIDVKAADADVLITGPLKWLLGGPGLSYLFVRRDRIAELTPTTTGWFGRRDQFEFDSSSFEFRDDAQRYEMGTPALPTVHAALGGGEIIEEVGVAAIRERNRALTERLIERVRDAGLRVRCAPEPDARSAIVMVEHEDPAGAVARLADRDVIVDYRPGYVRFSPHFYNTESEIDFAVDVMTGAAS